MSRAAEHRAQGRGLAEVPASQRREGARSGRLSPTGSHDPLTTERSTRTVIGHDAARRRPRRTVGAQHLVAAGGRVGSTPSPPDWPAALVRSTGRVPTPTASVTSWITAPSRSCPVRAEGLRALADRAAQHRLEQLAHRTTPASAPRRPPWRRPALHHLPRCHRSRASRSACEACSRSGSARSSAPWVPRSRSPTSTTVGAGSRVTERGSVGGVATAAPPQIWRSAGPTPRPPPVRAPPASSGHGWARCDDAVGRSTPAASTTCSHGGAGTCGAQHRGGVQTRPGRGGALDAVAERLTGRDPGWDRAIDC